MFKYEDFKIKTKPLFQKVYSFSMCVLVQFHCILFIFEISTEYLVFHFSLSHKADRNLICALTEIKFYLN